MDVHGVVLTGGRSSRMGVDKASLVYQGEEMGARVARVLSECCDVVTILGNKPVPGFDLLNDELRFGGPLQALAALRAVRPVVFVASCDVPFLTSQTVGTLCGLLTPESAASAIVPVVGGRLQPLCAAYKDEAFTLIPTALAERRTSVLSWIDLLMCERLDEPQLTAAGIDPDTLQGANTLEDWKRLTGQSHVT